MDYKYLLNKSLALTVVFKSVNGLLSSYKKELYLYLKAGDELNDEKIKISE